MPPRITSDTARQRELFKYYQPAQAPHFGHYPDSPGHSPRAAPRSSRDNTLTALAQLGCLRLNTRRAMISLVDQTFEYIVAEATQTLSLQSDDVHDDKDDLLAGNRTIHKSLGLCSFAVDKFVDDVKKAAANPGDQLAPKILVAPDLAEDNRFKSVGFSAAKSRLGFYAGVPIVSPQGYVIGVYSVIDDHPRKNITQSEQTFLTDIATTIMDHLESEYVKLKSYRAESMVKGMSVFIEGKTSLRDWWLQTGHKSRGIEKAGLRSGSKLQQRADDEYGVGHASSTASVADNLTAKAVGLVNLEKSEPLQQEPPPRSESWRSSRSSVLKLNPDNSLGQTQRNEFTTMWLDSVQSTTQVTPLESVFSQTTLDDMTTMGSTLRQSSSHLHEPQADFRVDLQLGEVEAIFSRASNLIREAMGVEGVIFFDAGARNYGGSTTKDYIRQRALGSFTSEEEVWTKSSSDEEALKSGSDSSRSESQETGHAKTVPLEKNCGILGWSTRSHSSLYNHIPADQHLNVPEKFLHKMFKRYPHGKIFNFSDDGTVSSSEDDFARELYKPSSKISSLDEKMLRRREMKTHRRKIETDTLRTIYPGAWSIAFMPLWDSHKEKWFAGSISWSTESTRVFDTEEDLTYLAAFGHNVMAEVSRANALVADQKKSDLISSISHELRSPLHGVLASIELLQDMNLDGFQETMVSAIDTCSKTLLDCLNHVLDYANVSGLTEARKSGVKQGTNSRPVSSRLTSQQRMEKLSKTQKSNVNLSALTAEVVETVLAGRLPSHKVMVILDVEKLGSWQLYVQPGAWRRVVMNLVTNALKYTETGFVRVSLQSNSLPFTKRRNPRSKVTLSVTDSGRGISKEFLRNQLFQPFNQENNFTSGLGLGLSIIHQIVKSLGGTIDIQSEQGIGTQVTVVATFDCLSKSEKFEHSHREVVIEEVALKAQKMTLCLVGLDVFPELSDEPTGFLSVDCQRMISLKSSLTSTLTDWFGFEVVAHASPVGVTADVFATTVSEHRKWQSQLSGDLECPLPGCVGGAPLLIVGPETLSASESICNEKQVFIPIQEPYGPYNLSQALVSYLRMQHNSLSQDGSQSPQSIAQRSMSGDPKVTSSNIKPMEPLPSVLDLYSLSIPALPHRVSQQNSIVPEDDDPVLSYKAVQSALEGTNQQLASDLAGSNAQEGHSSKISLPRRPRMLLVEDNPINLEVLAFYFKKLNRNFETAENGLVALNLFCNANPPFDLVITDISMPVMDGLTSTREMRKFETLNKIPSAVIIALTAATGASPRDSGLANGVDFFFTKPMPLKEVKAIVDGWQAKP